MITRLEDLTWECRSAANFAAKHLRAHRLEKMDWDRGFHFGMHLAYRQSAKTLGKLIKLERYAQIRTRDQRKFNRSLKALKIAA
jgi:hypothetical protein